MSWKDETDEIMRRRELARAQAGARAIIDVAYQDMWAELKGQADEAFRTGVEDVDAALPDVVLPVLLQEITGPPSLLLQSTAETHYAELITAEAAATKRSISSLVARGFFQKKNLDGY